MAADDCDRWDRGRIAHRGPRRPRGAADRRCRRHVPGRGRLWHSNAAASAARRNLPVGRFNTVLSAIWAALYVGASFGRASSTQPLVPLESALLTLDPATGVVIAEAELGEESDSTPSLGSTVRCTSPPNHWPRA